MELTPQQQYEQALGRIKAAKRAKLPAWAREDMANLEERCSRLEAAISDKSNTPSFMWIEPTLMSTTQRVFVPGRTMFVRANRESIWDAQITVTENGIRIILNDLNTEADLVLLPECQNMWRVVKLPRGSTRARSTQKG